MRADQNTTFNPSCTTRGSEAEVSFPKLGVPTTVPSPPKKGVLVELKNSARNWIRTRSFTEKFFSAERSKFTSPGFAITPAPELPKKSPAAICALVGIANAAGLIQLYGWWAAPCMGSPTISGRLLVVVLPNEKLSDGVARVPPW